MKGKKSRITQQENSACLSWTEDIWKDIHIRNTVQQQAANEKKAEFVDKPLTERCLSFCPYNNFIEDNSYYIFVIRAQMFI